MFSVIHSGGFGDDDPPVDSLSGLYDELLTTDQEHGDVAVVHQDTGWCISAHRDGRVVFERLGAAGSPRHMIPVPKELVLQLWVRLIEGDIEGLMGEPWKQGYTEAPGTS
jgi:hypothetical protein